MNQSGPNLFEAVIESWRMVFGNAAALVRASILPFFLFLGLHRLEELVRADGVVSGLAWGLVFTVLAAVPAVILLMPWYRQLLAVHAPAMSAEPAPGWALILMLRWAGLDVMFFIAMAPISALMIQSTPQAGESAAGTPGLVIFYYATVVIGAYLVYGRMGLAVPAAAAESDHSYLRSWFATRDIGWRIGFAVLICALSIEIPIGILRAPLAVEDPTLGMQYLDAALNAVFRVVNELLGAAVFVQFYLAGMAGQPEQVDE